MEFNQEERDLLHRASTLLHAKFANSGQISALSTGHDQLANIDLNADLLRVIDMIEKLQLHKAFGMLLLALLAASRRSVQLNAANELLVTKLIKLTRDTWPEIALGFEDVKLDMVRKI